MCWLLYYTRCQSLHKKVIRKTDFKGDGDVLTGQLDRPSLTPLFVLLSYTACALLLLLPAYKSQQINLSRFHAGLKNESNIMIQYITSGNKLLGLTSNMIIRFNCLLLNQHPLPLMTTLHFY